MYIYSRIQDEQFLRRRYSFDICRRKLYVNAWRRRTDDGHIKKIAGEREKGNMRGWKVAWMMSQVYRHASMLASIFIRAREKPLSLGILL